MDEGKLNLKLLLEYFYLFIIQRASISPTKKTIDKSSKTSTSSSPFKRVDAEVWSKEIKQGLEDNSYEKAFGVDGYGAKASAILMQVRGKDFKREMTKKKRGSYRGGTISLQSSSFKYDDE